MIGGPAGIPGMGIAQYLIGTVPRVSQGHLGRIWVIAGHVRIVRGQIGTDGLTVYPLKIVVRLSSMADGWREDALFSRSGSMISP